MYVEKDMKRFKEFLVEATINTTGWDKYASRLSNLLDDVDRGNPIQIQPGPPKGAGEISTVKLMWADPKYGVSLKNWIENSQRTQSINTWEYYKEKVLQIVGSDIKIDINNTIVKTKKYGGQSGDSVDSNIKEGEDKPRKSEVYEMGFCVAYNSNGKTLQELNSLFKNNDGNALLQASGITEVAKYQKSYKHLNKVGVAAVEKLKKIGSNVPLLHSGKANTEPVSFWKSPAEGIRGGTDGTWKSDIYFKGGAGISIKDESGGQYASGLVGETIACIYAANRDYDIQVEDPKWKKLRDEITTRIQDDMDIRQWDQEGKLIKGSGALDIKGNITTTLEGLTDFILDNWDNYLELNQDWALRVYGKGRGRGDKRTYSWEVKEKKAFAKAITLVVVGGGKISGAKKEWENYINDVKDFANKMRSEYVNSVRDEFRGITDNAKDNFITDLEKVIKQRTIHNEFNEYFEDLFDDNVWKKYVIYEASTGYRKWKENAGNKIPNPSESNPNAIASHILKFDKSYGDDFERSDDVKVELVPITLKWCSERAPSVNVNASFKTAGTTSPALRVAHYTPFQKGCEMIIENEFEKLD